MVFLCCTNYSNAVRPFCFIFLWWKYSGIYILHFHLVIQYLVSFFALRILQALKHFEIKCLPWSVRRTLGGVCQAAFLVMIAAVWFWIGKASTYFMQWWVKFNWYYSHCVIGYGPEIPTLMISNVSLNSLGSHCGALNSVPSLCLWQASHCIT
jgi:hypothetical protein